MVPNLFPTDRIRAYDFEGRTDCYIEGAVQRYGKTSDNAECVVILVDTDVWPQRPQHGSDNIGTRVGMTFLVPLEIPNDYEGRVIKLERAK